MAKRRESVKTHRLFKLAQGVLVGGVDSPVRSFSYVGGTPLLIKKGQGPRVYDYDGNSYIDFVLSWGAGLLGHANSQVVREVKRKLLDGFNFGATNDSEIELAAIIKEAVPFIQKIRFVNSGTEAVMTAIRLARGYTKREKILKFDGSYHGHADYLLNKAGSGLATLGIPVSSGVPQDSFGHTLIAKHQDIISVERIFGKYGGDIAAVIIEPVGGNNGLLLPEVKFLRQLRRLTRRYGALLIFDEVITGFRIHFGAAATKFLAIPDLICLGKIIGGGLPIGAVGGRDKIMKKLAPEGSVYQASTFAGNPVVMQSGVSTLKILRSKQDDYLRLNLLTQYLAKGMALIALMEDVPLKINFYSSMFSLRFANKELFCEFHRKMLDEGVYFAPSEFEVNFLSFAHSKKIIKDVLITADKVFRSMNHKHKRRL